MYFHGLLIDDPQYFIDEKKARPCFTGISPEINTSGSIYLPEKEGERGFPGPLGEGSDKARRDNYWYIKIDRLSFFYSC